MLRPLGGNGSSQRPRRGAAGLVSFTNLSRAISPVSDVVAPEPKPAAPSYEKFMDPIYVCWGDAPYQIGPGGSRPWGLADRLNRQHSMDNNQASVQVGYEYMTSIENNAVARIAALRNLVNYRLTTGSASTGGLQPFIDNSRRYLADVARSLATTYNKIAKSSDEAQKFAEIAGVSASLVASEAANFSALASKVKNDYELLDQAVRTYGPIAKTAQTGLMLAIELGKSGGSVKGKAAQAIDFLSSVALVIPGYGVFIAAGLSLVSGFFGAAAAATEELCRQTVEGIGTRAKTAVDEGLVIPWHAFDTFNLRTCPDDSMWTEGYEDTPDQESLKMLFGRNLRYGRGEGFGMTPGHRTQLQRWWGTAQWYMSDPRVSDVFRTLGYDASGGVIASDEQVMLVAAPVAVAYGMDVDDLARKLWDASPGWRAGVDSFELTVDGRAGVNLDRCNNTVPKNAWWVQWAVLAEKAFEIAEADKAARGAVMPILKVRLSDVASPIDGMTWGKPGSEPASKPGSEPASEPGSEPATSALVTVGLPAAAGLAAGFAFGGPIGIAVGVGAFVLSSLLGGSAKE